MKALLKRFQGRLLTYQQMLEVFGERYIHMTCDDIRVIPGITRNKQQTPRCHRCHCNNRDEFATIPDLKTQQEKYYCLRCLQMGRVLEGENLYHITPTIKDDTFQKLDNILIWKGQLSPQQSQASLALIESLEDCQRPHLVYAVTGAGKTEMIFPLIAEVIRKGGRVALASPRIDVCLELYPRIRSAFNHVDCLLMYGGTDQVFDYTPLVIATTHQLLKFRNAFDVTIVDEVDAFPYVNSDMLHTAVNLSVKPQIGKRIYLTATPDQHLFQEISHQMITVTRLPARFHGYPLVVPKFEWVGDWHAFFNQGKKNLKLYSVMASFIEMPGVKLLFAPSIKMAEIIYQWIIRHFSNISCQFVHSKDPQRKEKVQQLRDGTLELLISTTILERGVTFSNCQVLIMGADSDLFSSSALVQMSGRVGRKPDYPKGCLIFAHYGISKSMREAKRQIESMNDLAQERGLLNNDE